MHKFIYLTVATFMVLASWPYDAPVFAQTERLEKVDEIIQGFEDEPLAGDAHDNLMSGFEEDAPADSDAPLEEDKILQGFEEDATAEIRQAPEAENPPSWSLEGEFAFTTTYNFSPDANPPWRGFSMLRPELEVHPEKQVFRKMAGPGQRTGVLRCNLWTAGTCRLYLAGGKRI